MRHKPGFLSEAWFSAFFFFYFEIDPNMTTKIKKAITAELRKMRTDMLAPLPEPTSPMTPEQQERVSQLMKRMNAYPAKTVFLTTPGKVNESSFFDQVWSGKQAPALTWADAAIALHMTDDHKEIIDRQLTVQRGKLRGEHLVKADPQYIYSIPTSLKDLTDEHPGPDEPHQGTDPVPGDPEQGT